MRALLTGVSPGATFVHMDSFVINKSVIKEYSGGG